MARWANHQRPSSAARGRPCSVRSSHSPAFPFLREGRGHRTAYGILRSARRPYGNSLTSAPPLAPPAGPRLDPAAACAPRLDPPSLLTNFPGPPLPSRVQCGGSGAYGTSTAEEHRRHNFRKWSQSAPRERGRVQTAARPRLVLAYGSSRRVNVPAHVIGHAIDGPGRAALLHVLGNTSAPATQSAPRKSSARARTAYRGSTLSPLFLIAITNSLCTVS